MHKKEAKFLLQDHAKVVQFVSLAGEVTGRKKLQKMIFIAKKMNFSFQEKYSFHMYGPYSEELTVRVEELCNLGFMTERKEDKGSYVQYCYAPTESGKEFTTILGEENPRLKSIIEKMNAKSSRFLELVATLLYFDDLKREEQIEKVKIVKAKLNYSTEELQSGITFIYDYIITR